MLLAILDSMLAEGASAEQIVKVVKAALKEQEEKSRNRRERNRQKNQRWRDRQRRSETVTAVTAENINEVKDRVRGNGGQTYSKKEELDSLSELDFVSEDQTYIVRAEQFHAWATMFPPLTAKYLRTRWGALYREWLGGMSNPAERKRAFENKIKKDLRKRVEKGSVVEIRPDYASKPEYAGMTLEELECAFPEKNWRA